MEQIITPIIKEINNRLNFLISVGLSYLSLSRESSTLAGGEAQRIRLASQIGTGLTGVTYILDEPTIGLHPRDNKKLIDTLKTLRDKGNSVIVVEHDRDVIKHADYLFDFGPYAGSQGGTIVYQGKTDFSNSNNKSLTAKYLIRKKNVSIKPKSTKLNTDGLQWIEIKKAKANNLKSIDLRIPTGKITCITGVSGSGKSTLLEEVIYKNAYNLLNKQQPQQPIHASNFILPLNIQKVSMIDQGPIGKTPRSNPATYTKTFDLIRQLFALSKDAQIMGMKAGHFSFNVKGGRCEACQGEGQLKVEMQFLPDIFVKCEVCKGKRYNTDTLEIKYHDKNIAEILDMTVDDALQFFSHQGAISQKLQILKKVGLGYIKLGQPAPTLSGGEAQRIKLAKELSNRSNKQNLYLLDEPTTGLHFYDVQKLLNILDALKQQGNTIVLIEHNLDTIRNCDWIIDLGPEGGSYGGNLIINDAISNIRKYPNSETAQYLIKEIDNE